MVQSAIERRLSTLEAEVARLKARLEGKEKSKNWLDMIWGSFANDPIYDEAMRLGREYRESQGPKPRKKRRK